MKYIRTQNWVLEKDKVEIAVSYKTTETGEVARERVADSRLNIYEDILKESDNLLDVCDSFVIYEKDQGKPIDHLLDNREIFEKMKAVILLGMYAKIDCWLKLAIWTDKGLVFVAEMNGGGDFNFLCD